MKVRTERTARYEVRSYGMIVRVFFGECVADCPMENRDCLSVGSSGEDTVSLTDRGLQPSHARVERVGSRWMLRCLGPVSNHGEPVQSAPLPASAAFVLGDAEQRVSLVCFEPGETQLVRCPAAGASLSIGCLDGNEVAVKSKFVSREHCRIENRDGALFLIDRNSSNGVYLNYNRLQVSTQLKDGDMIVLGDVTLRLSGAELILTPPASAECAVAAGAQADRRDEEGRIVYQRSPRLKKAVPDCTVEIEAPPALGGKPEINWLSTFLPMIATVGIAVIMAVAFSQPMMMLYTLPMTVAGLIVTLTNFRKQKKKFSQQQETRLVKYNEHLNEAVARIHAVQEQQLEALNYADPETERCFDVPEMRSRTLWDRRPIDADFCALRIGSGPVASAAEIRIPRSNLTLEEDELRDRPRQILKTYQEVSPAPIVCDLKKHGILGVVGPHTDAVALIRNLLVQYAVHQSYTEAALISIWAEADRTALDWINDLPHALDEERRRSYTATTAEQADRLLSEFAEVLKERKLEQEDRSGAPVRAQPLPFLLFVVTESALLNKDNPINEFLLRNRDLGAGLILAAEDIQLLPKECNQIITIRDGKGEMFNKDDATNRQSFTMDSVGSYRFTGFGRQMRRIVCEEIGKKSAVPKSYTFFEMQGICTAEEWDIGRHWAGTDVTKTLCAPIGMGEGEQTVELDLHEKSHGPHGLIAGTTGSGKSEVMLSYILSLALRYHPYEIGFVIIDFKGGGLANQLADLPHLLGAITNIEGAAIDRSLSSFKAELLKRQRLFAEAGVNSIDKYIQKYKSGQTGTPLPHLVIIVDEFAELKAEQPEFMKELISAARIGRSLGIHLILATQKPAGQVSEQIWSNSRFQICLKVATREDSNEVIKSSLAFTIKEPGRAYLRVGNNEVFSLFQSGYSGVKLPGSEQTQLEAVLEHIAAYCREKGIVRLPPICLPALLELIDFPQERVFDPETDTLSIGVCDDPDNQFQGPFVLDLFSKNTLIVGTSLSGKTNLLQTILRGVADSCPPEEVSVYILDFASMVLKNFEPLRHVGGVVTSLEDEKLKNLLKLLNAEIEDRRSSFLGLGVSSFAAYMEAGRRDKPRILLMIDNLTALRELYFQEEDSLLPLLQSGLTYGISVLATNGQTAGLGYKYLANFSNRIAMFCNDTAEYGALFDHCALRIPDVHGRCIVEQEKRHYACQIYLSFAGEKEVERAAGIRSWVQELGERYTDSAKPIPTIPERLEMRALLYACAAEMRKSRALAIGLDYESVAPVYVQPERMGVLGLSGSPDACRGFVRCFLRTWEELQPGTLSAYVADGLERGLTDCADEVFTAEYSFLPAKALELVKTVEAELARRYEALMRGEQEENRLLALVLCGPNSIEAVCADAATLNAYKNIIGKYKALNVCVLLSECENTAVNYNSPEIMKKLKEEQKLLLFDELSNLKMFDLPYAMLKKFKKPLSPGDAYFIRAGECSRIKTPEPD